MAIGEVKRRGKAKDAVIESKDQRWHCRNRVTLVFGSNDVEDLETYIYTGRGIEFTTVQFHQAKSKAIEEILDNCIDEFYRGHVTEVHVELDKDSKTVRISDNGIGLPLSKATQVYTEFRTGSKFKDETVDKKGFLIRTLGQNGLGASATCLTSDYFKATIRHYNSKKEQSFEFFDGALKQKKSKAKTFRGASGVHVELILAQEVYGSSTIDKNLLLKRIIDLAYNNPGLTFFFNGRKFLFKRGLLELAQQVDKSKAILLGDDSFRFEWVGKSGKKLKGLYDIHVSLCLNPTSDERENIISFVNSTPTYDGGHHVDRIRRNFINAIKEKLERATKREKMALNDNDILSGITFIIGVTMPNPRFESQTKRKLVKDTHLEKAIEKFMVKSMKKFFQGQKDYLDVVIERAKSRQKFQALKDAAKQGKKAKKQRVEKLLDANERKDRRGCALFICEGDSAIGGLRSARDKLKQGGIALRGKPMNVSQASLKDILANQEFSDIMASIGLTIGQKAQIEELRYSRIVFLSDSDVDGGHINALLTNFFFAYWPELFSEGAIQIAKAPLFEVITNQGVLYAETPEELESFKKKKSLSIKEIQRNKGLGEMSPEAWKFVLRRESFTKITVADMKKSQKMLQVCFGKETGPRKDLLMDE
ncbi:MAG: toprim domain-containing protein [Bacteriovoracales bacterium]|nr:toprim domain-containing protein [Bacteriovoracales bacterium]